jgi:hypothetical protein
VSIHDLIKKINPKVNFRGNIYYSTKAYYKNRVNPLLVKLKDGLDFKEDLFIVLVIILIGLAGFGLGKLSALEKKRGEVEFKKSDFKNATSTSSTYTDNKVIPMSAAAMIASETAQGLLVASKSGQKYHFPWCAGASQIADKNKIWFDSYEDAQRAGYTPATNCKGLK